MKSKNCLILDDNEINSFLIASMLDNLGGFSYQVYTYPKQLLHELELIEPDFIFINVMMKDKSVRELACNEGMPIHKFIFISDLYRSEEKRKCFLDNHRPYITTPLSPEVIREGIFQA